MSGKETKVSTLDEISVDEYHLVDGDNVMEDTDPRDETELYSKYESSTKSRPEMITLDKVGARHGDASQVIMDCVQGSFVTTAWTNDSKTRDIEGVVGENNIEDVHEALEEICFNLKTRKKQFEKFVLVIIDDESLSLKFDKAYRDGIKKSKEPLYEAYRELRKAAEPTEDEALDTVISNNIPSGLKRPLTKGSKYPLGHGRYVKVQIVAFFITSTELIIY